MRPRGGLGPSPRPPGDLLQQILYNRFRPESFPSTGVEIERQKRRDIRPTTMHRSEDRATKPPRTGRQRETGVKAEWQKKRLGTITTWNHIQPFPTSWVVVTPVCSVPAAGLGGIYYCRSYTTPQGWSRYWRSYGRPGPLPRQGHPPSKFAFSFKPSRLAGAISADVRSAERACRSELIMRERRLRSE